jgi:hypothetical protein
MNASEFGCLVITARDKTITDRGVEIDAVVKQLLADLRTRDRLAVLEVILPDAVRRVLNNPPPTKPMPSTIHHPSATSDDPDLAKDTSTPNTLAQDQGPSWRSMYAYFKRTLWAPEFGDYHRPLGDLTAEMVAQVAAYRHAQGADVEAQAVRLDTLRQLMIDEGASIVADLPVQKVRDILTGGV